MAVDVNVRWLALADDAAEIGPSVRFPHSKPRLVGQVAEADLKPIVAQMLEQRGDLQTAAIVGDAADDGKPYGARMSFETFDDMPLKARAAGRIFSSAC